MSHGVEPPEPMSQDKALHESKKCFHGHNSISPQWTAHQIRIPSPSHARSGEMSLTDPVELVLKAAWLEGKVKKQAPSVLMVLMVSGHTERLTVSMGWDVPLLLPHQYGEWPALMAELRPSSLYGNFIDSRMYMFLTPEDLFFSYLLSPLL